MKGPFSESKLRELAENVIDQQDALDHEEETGHKVLFVHHEVTQLFDPQIVAGKEGNSYKFQFAYDLEVVEEDYPDEPYRARYLRTIRLNEAGVVKAFGARTLVEEIE